MQSAHKFVIYIVEAASAGQSTYSRPVTTNALFTCTRATVLDTALARAQVIHANAAPIIDGVLELLPHISAAARVEIEELRLKDDEIVKGLAQARRPLTIETFLWPLTLLCRVGLLR
eukprot:2081615-Pleurochrysis_carterae.AAC.1